MATTTRPERTTAAPTTPQWALVATAVSFGVLVLALLVSGTTDGTEIAGLTDPGVLTRWGLPVAKLLVDAAATVTIGFLLLAVMLPAQQREVSRDGIRALRVASLGALVWAAATAAVHLLTLSDLLGEPVWTALRGVAFETYTTSVSQGQASAVVVVLTLTLAVAARLTLGQGGAVAVLLLGIGALVPPAVTGHSSTGDYHHSAAVSLLVHIVGVALWVGGLVAVSWYAGTGGRHLPRVVRTYSPLALACFVAVAASGALNAYVRLGSPADLLTTTYGLLLTAKIAGIVALGWFGLRQRRVSLPAVAAGRPGAFRRFAAVEVVIMAATVTLAVVLSRTAPPVTDVVAELTRARELLGFTPPPAPTAARLLLEVYPDAVYALGCLAALLLYGAGLVRLRRRGDKWPVGRTISWVLGVLLVAAVTLTGLMTYGMLQLSVHMAQHMVLSMVAPVFLVLGAPVTLALRAISPAPRGQTGAREALLAILQSRAVKVLSNPLVAFALFVSAPFMTYFSPLFEFAMRHHTAHIAMNLHFLAVGYLFAEVLVGLDPLPRRPPYPFRMLMQLGALGVHAFFGVALMNAANLVAGPWYRELGADVPWLPDPATDQRLAGGIAWGFGEIPALLLLLVLFVQWFRSDEREARRKDRAGDDELDAYNEYLAKLSGPRGRGS